MHRVRNEGQGEPQLVADVEDHGDLDGLIAGNGALMDESDVSLHGYLRHGHLEKVYENGLAHRLEKAGIHFERQYPLKVSDEDGTTLGEYYADFLVEECLIVELKACKVLVDEHTAQILAISAPRTWSMASSSTLVALDSKFENSNSSTTGCLSSII